MMILPAKALLLIPFLFFTFLSVASAEFHVHPEFEKKSAHIKRIALLPTRIDMFEIGAGGGLEKMEAWSQAARTHTRNAIKEEFAKREHLQLAEFDDQTIPNTALTTYNQTLLLYDVIFNAIITHTFPTPYYQSPLFFPWKLRDFAYSLGQEIDVFALNVDAYLLVRGFDQRSSGGRKALGVGTTLVGAALGVAIIPQRGENLFAASLIDAHTGDILWFSKSLTPYDLREPEEATKLVIELMTDLPTIGSLTKSQ